MKPLATRKCSDHRKSPAIAPAALRRRLTGLAGWTLVEAGPKVPPAITREFAFKDFHQTMAFVNAVAYIANVEDHHPDLSVHWGKCVVSFNTHTAGGVTEMDLICAAKVNALIAE